MSEFAAERCRPSARRSYRRRTKLVGPTTTAPATLPKAALGPSSGPSGPALETLTLAEGWGDVSFTTSSVQTDNPACLTRGIIALMKRSPMRAKPDDRRAPMAWS